MKRIIGKIVWKDANQAEVEGGYYEGNFSACGNTYYCEQEKWQMDSPEK